MISHILFEFKNDGKEPSKRPSSTSLNISLVSQGIGIFGITGITHAVPDYFVLRSLW